MQKGERKGWGGKIERRGKGRKRQAGRQSSAEAESNVSENVVSVSEEWGKDAAAGQGKRGKNVYSGIRVEFSLL